jgi:hypothetical protein
VEDYHFSSLFSRFIKKVCRWGRSLYYGTVIVNCKVQENFTEYTSTDLTGAKITVKWKLTSTLQKLVAPACKVWPNFQGLRRL